MIQESVLMRTQVINLTVNDKLRHIPFTFLSAADKGIEPLPAGSEPAALPLRQSAFSSFISKAPLFSRTSVHACGGARTHDLPVKSRLLSQLSYTRPMRTQGVEP